MSFIASVPIHVTGAWSDGLGGEFETLFARLRMNGLAPYDWTLPEHRLQSNPEQSSAIFRHIGNSKAFLFIIGEADHDYSASQKQLGAALAFALPIFVVDPKHGLHKGRDGSHIAIDDFHCRAAIDSRQMKIFATVKEAEQMLSRLGPTGS